MSTRLSKRELLSVIEDIYQAGLDPEGWQRVVSAIHALFPETGVTIQAHHHGDPPRFLVVDAGHDPRFIREYRRDHAATNPWAARIPQMPIGVPVVIDESSFLPEISRTDFHHFLDRNGCGSGIGLPIWSAPQRAFFMAAHYPRQAASRLNAPVGRLARVLSPHLARSFAISHRLGTAPGEPSGLASLLQRVAAPLLVVDETRRVAFANRAGEDLLASRPRLHCRRRGLALPDPAADAALGGAIRASVRRQFDSGPPSVVTAAGLGDQLRMVVMPIAADASLSKGAADGASANMALVLFVGAPPSCDTLALLRARFGLTAAEAELAAALADGTSLNGCADRRGVALATVRNQLQSIFAKTATGRQAELVALLSRLGHH